ncbi:MAG TPA: hypothetical protein ENI23_03795 [bacterium]|nr:hypothetical protein [bacterium]
MMDVPKKILLITPGIKNSRGHEIHGYAIEQSLKQYTDVEVISLKQIDTSLIGKLIIWPGIQIMKQLIASLPFLKFDEATRGKTADEYKVALTTKLIGRGLVKYLKSQDNPENLTLVSSHYAGVAAGKEAGLTRLTEVGPDFYPHDQTAIPRTYITSPSESFTKELKALNVEDKYIKKTGAILTPAAAKNAVEENSIRDDVASGKKNPMHILITMGGAGPEANEVVAVVEKIRDLILDGHQLCSISVVAGDNRANRRRLRKKLMNIVFDQILNDTDGCGFRVFGGEKGFTKKDEVVKTWELLASSKDTNGLKPVDLVFTRPNDISLISTAMGIPTVLFTASGSHEVKARKHMAEDLKTSVLFEDWMVNQQMGKIIEIGTKVLRGKKIGSIPMDSGEKLIEVVKLSQ